MRALGKSTAAGFTAVALLGAGISAAYADGILVDGDSVVTRGGNNTLDLGTVACDTGVSSDVLIAAIRRGNGDKADPVFKNGSTVSVSVSAVTGAGLSAVMGADTSIVVDSLWTTLDNNAISSDTAASSVRLTSSTTGAGSGTVTYRATGTATDNDPISRTETLKVSWTTGACSTNEAPSAPGAPVATASPSQGGFTLSWTASTDKEGNAVTYTLEGRDSDDAEWTQVASGLTTTSHGFGAGSPAEGTWTYRVRAVESGTSPALSSGWSTSSLPVVVDRTKPNAPSASADRPAEYQPTGASSWWKDTVTVTFSGNGDPTLPDTSAGSGVADWSESETVSATGPFTTAGRTVTDRAGNVSEPTTFSGSVDATAPTLGLTCPASVVQGASAYASWTASDVGSGLATPTSGQVALDTSSIGSRTATAPAGTALDNVGHESAAATCSYSVVYDFSGFFQPVDMDKMNVAKAGSAIPIKFSLHGYQGMDIIAAGFPKFAVKAEAQSGDAIEQTVTAGSSSLSYDPVADQYVYVWKTDKAWAGKSGTFALKLNDGTTHTADFSFRK